MRITFEELGFTDFEITNIMAINQKWDENCSFSMNTPRPTDAFLFFDGCDAILSRKGSEDMHIKKDSFCYIPSGDMYTWTFLNGDSRDIWTMLFEFVLFDKNGERLAMADRIKVLDNNHAGLYRHLFQALISECAKPKSSFAKIKAAAYTLISAITDVLRETHVTAKNFKHIYSGIKYLDENPLQEKSIAEIADMCGVSVNYFERLFKEYSGMTPAVYRLTKKTERAKNMLRTPVMSVEQIAYELNYSDCAYFCRSFKKLCGVTPTEYRKLFCE